MLRSWLVSAALHEENMLFKKSTIDEMSFITHSVSVSVKTQLNTSTL